MCVALLRRRRHERVTRAGHGVTPTSYVCTPVLITVICPRTQPWKVTNYDEQASTRARRILEEL